MINRSRPSSRQSSWCDLSIDNSPVRRRSFETEKLSFDASNDSNDEIADIRRQIQLLEQRLSYLERSPLQVDIEGNTQLKLAPSPSRSLKKKISDLPKKTSREYAELSFWASVKDRSSWLVGLLVFQSCSSFILAQNDALLQRHPVIVHFLTMLVGAGGNAGNQASVRVIRGLATGSLHSRNRKPFLIQELNMAVALTIILSLSGFLRAAFLSRTPPTETFAITLSLSMIVFSSICLGALLPLLLQYMGFDPAHSSTTIQVVMDILGVVLTVNVCAMVLSI